MLGAASSGTGVCPSVATPPAALTCTAVLCRCITLVSAMAPSKGRRAENEGVHELHTSNRP